MGASVVPRSQSGIKDPDGSKKAKLAELAKKRDKKNFAQFGKAGESDRRIQEKKPKHLYCGKRGIGKNDRRRKASISKFGGKFEIIYNLHMYIIRSALQTSPFC